MSFVHDKITAQARLQDAINLAVAETANHPKAELSNLITTVGERNKALRGDLTKVVKGSLAYLMQDGTINHINSVLENVNEGDRLMIQSLIQWATPYKMVSIHDDEAADQSDDQKAAIKEAASMDTRKRVAGKDRALEKWGKNNEEDIKRASGENYIAFMEVYKGDVYEWAAATAKARKTQFAKDKAADDKQKWDNEKKSAKFKVIHKKLGSWLKKYEDDLGEDIIDEILEILDDARKDAKTEEKD